MMNENERKEAEIRSIMRLTLGEEKKKAPKKEKPIEEEKTEEKKAEKKETKKAKK